MSVVIGSIDMQIGSYQFRPKIWVILLTVILVPVFAALGSWQISRGKQLQEKQMLVEKKLEMPAVLISGMVSDSDSIKYRMVKVSGSFEKDHEFLVKNVGQGVRLGYHVYTPLRIHNSDIRVLVNRGWLPYDAKMGNLPEIETPTNTIELEGYVKIPSEQSTSGREVEIVNGVWSMLDFAHFVSTASYQTQPFVILEHENSPHGYVRSWTQQFLAGKPEANYSYAAQWFVFALLLLLGFFKYSLVKNNLAK